MKKIIFTIVLVFAVNAIFAQTMVIKKTDNSTVQILSQDITEITFIGLPCPGTQTVDYGGKTYNTVQIGTQCWLKENLDIGTRIAGSSNQTNNGGTNIIEKYCYDDLDANCATYGGLYQWAEAVKYQNGATNTTITDPALTGNVQGICPTEWHIPTKVEFETCITNVNGNGNALKALGEGILNGGNDGRGTNLSGFSALFAGYRYGDGSFYNLGDYYAYFWSTTENIENNVLFVYLMTLHHSFSSTQFSYGSKDSGVSVRCLKD